MEGLAINWHFIIGSLLPKTNEKLNNQTVLKPAVCGFIIGTFLLIIILLFVKQIAYSSHQFLLMKNLQDL